MNAPLMGAVLVEALAACGVTDVVLSPGSRNAPVSLALFEADRDARVRLHVRVDERVAAFTALGLARATGRVVAVCTTSGTAAGNLLPAAMEARAAGVGLVLITCDRPAELVGTGANQTCEQPGLFGPAALQVVRLSSTSGTAESWAAAVRRAHVTASGLRSRAPGPVQLNVELGGNLVGPVPRVEVPAVQIAESAPPGAVSLEGQVPTVVLVGDADPATGEAARRLAEEAGVPLLAEPSSNARAGDYAVARYRLLLEGELGRRIRRVVCFGHPTLSRPVSALLARDDVDLGVVSGRAGWSDVGHRARIVCDAVSLPPQDPQWLAEWKQADAHLTETPEGDRLDGPLLIRTVLRALGSEDVLFLGASQLLRDADVAPISPQPPVVFSNRGLSGIDGTLSTATGVALGLGRPVTVVLGDLTLQHDLGALVCPPLEPAAQLRVVVGHDDGGAIFSTLEQGAPQYADAFERVFGTPQGVDLAAVGSALGWDSSTVTTADDLSRLLQRPLTGRQLIVVPLSRPAHQV